LRDRHDELRSRGAEAAVVSCGRPPHAQRVREALSLPYPVFVDPRQEAFRAAGLRRGVWNTIGSPAWRAGWTAMRDGFRQGRTQGDPWQQGGTFVIDDGRVRLEHVSRAAGDVPDWRRVLEALG
jgi:hypothetical protein